MEILKNVIWVVEIISAIVVIVLVLLQHGKGADAGATFGSGGGSGSLFGASGSSNFLSRTTAIFATIFFATTFALVMLLSNGRVGSAGVMAGLNSKDLSSGVSSSVIATKPIASQSGAVNGGSHVITSASGATHDVVESDSVAKNIGSGKNQIPQ
jgi:preprotein translocase subunit SecG